MSRDGRDRAAGIVVSAAWVIGLALVAKALGLFKDVVVASKFGTSAVMDSFNVALMVPLLLVGWFRTPFRAGFVPHFTETLEHQGERAAWRSAGVFVGNITTVTLGAALVIAVAAPWIVGAVAPGLDAASRELATSLTRVMVVAVVFATMSGVLMNIAHCHRNFALPGFANPANNLVLIAAALFLTGRYGIFGLAYGIALGSLAQVLVQLPIVWQHRQHFRFRVDFSDPTFRSILMLAIPLFIGMAGAKLDDVVDKVFASMLAEGSISGLAYALRLIELPREILVVAFSTVLFPFFSRVAARGGAGELGDRLIASIRIAFFILLPVSAGMALLGDPLVRAVFQRGAFDEESVRMTVSALVLYTPMIWALGITTIMISGFMATKDTKTPVVAGFVRLGIKIGLVFLLIGRLEHAGIALSTSVSHVLKLILLLIVLPKELRGRRYPLMFRAFIGAALATGVMSVVLYLAAPYASSLIAAESLAGKVILLASLAVLGTLSYLGAALVFARPELNETLAAVRAGLADVRRRASGRPVELPDDD